MPSIVPEYEYDIFISYRQNDNRSGWVTDFVNALQDELAATLKDPLSIYFDSNPHDGLHETHDVDGSLREKVKCLIFIPIVSRTYCDHKAFAWQKEFLPFLEFARQDEYGLDVKLQGGNVTKRVLPVRIHELAAADKKLIEDEMNGPLRAIDFVYQSAGVNRPLTPDDARELNVQKTFYKDQLNKTANAIHDIITTMQMGDDVSPQSVTSEEKPQPSSERAYTEPKKRSALKLPTLGQAGRLRLLNVIFLITIGVLALLYYSSSQESDKLSFSASILPPENLYFTSDFSISPDGKSLAYVTRDSLGNSIMWVQQLETLSGQPLPGTEGAGFPFWSPDSQFIGFFDNEKLKKVKASGGPVLTLCDLPNPGRGGSWNREGMIIFGAVGSPLYKVTDTGGAPERLTFDSSGNELSQRWPWFLPDGTHFLYTSQRQDENAIFLASLDTALAPRLLFNASSSAQYTDGYLLFGSQETLMAQSFDARSGQLTEDPFPVAENLDNLRSINNFAFSVSANGVILYQQNTNRSFFSINWYDREGKKLHKTPMDDVVLEVVLSPDAKRIALSKLSNGYFDIWIYDVDRSSWNRFTFDEGDERWPDWSPDGKTIIYSSNRDGKSWNLYRSDANGSGNVQEVVSAPEDLRYTSWSQDAKYLAYGQRNTGENYDIWIKPLDENGEEANEQVKPFVFLDSKYNELHPSFSPDSRWIAYQSDESGRQEIYLRQFPGPGGKRQISTSGGIMPHWRSDGKELFFISPDNTIMVQAIDLNSASLLGPPIPLFKVNRTGGPFANPYDVSPDGKQFVVSENKAEGTNQPLVLMVNWLERLKKNTDKD